MKKTNFTYVIVGVCALTILIIIFVCYISVIKSNENNGEIVSKITDECTEEWDEYIVSVGDAMLANSGETVVLPNTKLSFENYYKSCGHIETKEETASEDIVNMNEEQLEYKYADYNIENFMKEEINLYKEIDGLCDKHYLLIEEDGYVGIYKLKNNGDKVFAYKTNISSEYLTEMDRVQLKQGIYVYGEEELNKTLEDFE